MNLLMTGIDPFNTGISSSLIIRAHQQRTVWLQ
jgi:hypothetical protein